MAIRTSASRPQDLSAVLFSRDWSIWRDLISGISGEICGLGMTERRSGGANHGSKGRRRAPKIDGPFLVPPSASASGPPLYRRRSVVVRICADMWHEGQSLQYVEGFLSEGQTLRGVRERCPRFQPHHTTFMVGNPNERSCFYHSLHPHHPTRRSCI